MSGILDVAKRVYHTVMWFALIIQRPPMTRHGEVVSAVAFFKDGRRLVTGSLDSNLRICDVQKREVLGGPLKGHQRAVISVAISPDDRRIASGGEDKAIIIWDVETKQVMLLVKLRSFAVSVCFSPDGKRLASGLDGDAVIWDAETGAVLSTFQGHCSLVHSVAFSPDGLKLASGSDCTIRVWRTDNSACLLKIDAHYSSVSCVVWSPDGQQLVSGSHDKTVKFWNSSNGDQIGETCTSHTGWIQSVTISSDSYFIATASDDRTVRLWSTETHQQIGPAMEHSGAVNCVAMSRNGELLVSADLDGIVSFWSIENTIISAFAQHYSLDYFFARRSKARLRQNLHLEALSDAEKVIELNPSIFVGYELKHAALHGVQRYDEAIEAFKIMLSKLEDDPDPLTQEMRQKYLSPSEVDGIIRRAIYAHLENAPLRLFNTSTGRLCDREAQINAFMESTEYMELLSSSVAHAFSKPEPIKEAVAKYFGWAMLSHRWEKKEPRLHDIQDKDAYTLDPIGTIVKLQKFCEVARDAGHRWAWSDTCCIDQNNNVELQESVNSMFVWYRHSALTIVYLSDVLPLSKSGALANSTWNTRGWTVQEFLAPNIVLFYRADWTLYLDDCSHNHKESVSIMQELEHSTGINARALVAFRPGMRGAREKLQWASSRVTTLQEDIAYSLFGIFGVHLPVIYGEKRQNALGRLLQEIVAHSGDITALDWVGKSSDFNSCLPADISSYKAPPCMLPALTEHEMQTSVSMLRNTVAAVSASKLYTLLDNLSAPRFANSRLQLPCIAFPVTEIRRRRSQDRQSCFTYDVKADGLQDLLITTEDKLIQFSPARPTPQTFLLIRPWNRHDLGLPDFADDVQSVDESVPDSPLDDSFGGYPGDDEREPVDTESHARELRLMVRLGQPFGALFLAQQRGSEYKRIASDNNIIAQVEDLASVHDMDVRTLELL